MIKRIKEILNQIHEESIHKFISNQSLIQRLIFDSIKEQQNSSSSFDEDMLWSFKAIDYKLDELTKELRGKGITTSIRNVDDNVIKSSKTYRDFIYREMTGIVLSVFEYIYDKINNGTIELYRALDIKGADWISHLEKQGKHLGVYWADDFDKAEAYWGTGGNSYIVHTVIDEKDIDWYNTFMARLDRTLGDEEQEIRLFKGTPIRILNLYDGDTKEEINIDSIKDKTFYA